MYNRENGIPPEHPRASTSDDVECFFSVLRDMVGKDFTRKEVLPLMDAGDVWLEEGVFGA